MGDVRKAVIPAAGLGTRLLPASKAIPKEMLPIVDKPAIQYVVEEAAAAGIEDILVITAPSKRAIEDHFDRYHELEASLHDKGKMAALDAVLAPTRLANMHFRRQGGPLGLGHAIGMARNYVGDEPFAVLLPDDIVVDGGRLLREMIGTFERSGSIVIAAAHFPLEQVIAYGVIEALSIEGDEIEVARVVEKPKLRDAKSNYGLSPGRYVFPPSIFDAIDATEPDSRGEIQITDAMIQMLATPGVKAKICDSRRYDAGQKLDYLRATVELALADTDLGPAFRDTLTTILESTPPDQ